MNKNKGMTEIVKTITALIRGAIVVFGLNIILYGHVTPGGGFAGGLIIAFLFVLNFLAFGREGDSIVSALRISHIFDSAGALGFLSLGILGILLGGAFLNNFFGACKGRAFSLCSGGFIPLENVAIGLKVSAAIFLVFVSLAIFRREK